VRRFLANENVDGPSVRLLRANGLDVLWMAEYGPGTPDVQVMELAHASQRTIITHDSDYGELIFKHGHRPQAGVVYFRLHEFLPGEPAQILLDILHEGRALTDRLIVIDHLTVRERKYGQR